MYLDTQLLFILSFAYFTKAFQQPQKPVPSILRTGLMDNCSNETYLLEVEDLTLNPPFPKA